jgi:hypothetical protein
MPIKDMLKDKDPFSNKALQGPEDISEWKRIPVTVDTNILARISE